MDHDAVRSLHGRVGELWRDDSHHGWIACRVYKQRFLLWPFRSHPGVDIRCTFLDGRLEPDEEDYPPYYSVSELLAAKYSTADDVAYEVRWLDGDARDAAWTRSRPGHDMRTSW